MFMEVRKEVLAERKAKKDEESGKETKKGSEKGTKVISLSEDQFKALETASNEGVKAMRELREMKMTETVNSFVYSEDNKAGVLLKKSGELASKLMFTLGEKQRVTFTEFLNSLPKIKIFAELGNEEVKAEIGEAPEGVDSYSFQLDVRAKKLMSEKKFKIYSEAVFAAEKELKEEGITPEME